MTLGQLRYELNWLCLKVQERDPARYQQLLSVQGIECHPSFEVVEGAIEEWEKVRITSSHIMVNAILTLR